MGELEPRKLRGMKGVNMDFAEKFPGGVWPVMLTPYTEKGAIDEDALAALTEWYVGSGVKGLFAACQSSEIFYLNQKERLKIVEITMEAARGRVPVIASANTSEDIEAQAEELNAVWDLGVDAAILLSNRLAGPEDPEEVWTENFYRLLDRLNPDIRLGIYECPYPYKRILRSREIQAMVGTGKFHFLKDTCCDIAAIRQKLEQVMDQYGCVKAHRGRGLMQGLEFAWPVAPVVKNALLEQRLVLISAGSNVIRFVPPLIIEREDVDEMVRRLQAAIEAGIMNL